MVIGAKFNEAYLLIKKNCTVLSDWKFQITCLDLSIIVKNFLKKLMVN